VAAHLDHGPTGPPGKCQTAQSAPHEHLQRTIVDSTVGETQTRYLSITSPASRLTVRVVYVHFRAHSDSAIHCSTLAAPAPQNYLTMDSCPSPTSNGKTSGCCRLANILPTCSRFFWQHVKFSADFFLQNEDVTCFRKLFEKFRITYCEADGFLSERRESSHIAATVYTRILCVRVNVMPDPTHFGGSPDSQLFV